jgi:ABC-type antimicrobial peptide transport system permease subunit
MMTGSATRERLMAGLSGFFGAIALVLAAVGVYGVVAYTVAARQREIGIRVALGASTAHVVRTVVGRVGLVATVGVVAGALLTVPMSAMARSLFYGVDLDDARIIASILIAII